MVAIRVGGQSFKSKHEATKFFKSKHASLTYGRVGRAIKEGKLPELLRSLTAPKKAPTKKGGQ